MKHLLILLLVTLGSIGVVHAGDDATSNAADDVRMAQNSTPGVLFQATPSGDSSWWAAYTESLENDVDGVTAYWDEAFPALWGFPYPGVCATVEYEPATVPYQETCRVSPETAEGNAFYCIPENVVMWDGPSFFHPIYDIYGDKALTYIIAHEYGHAAQFLSGDVPRGDVRTELQADCYAGAYLAWAEDAGYTQPGDYQEVLRIVRPVGQSRVGTTWWSRTHGTSAQRTAALAAGYQNGADTCQDQTTLQDVINALPQALPNDGANLPDERPPGERRRFGPFR